jgi:hypothetical protein
MPLPVIAGAARVAVRGTTVRGTKWVNILHFRYAAGASAPGTSEYDALDIKLRKLYAASPYVASGQIASLMHTTSKIDEVQYTALNGVGMTYIKTWAIAGLDAQDALPPGNSMVVSLRTAVRGKRYRGRVYLPPACEDANVLGVINSTFITNLVGNWTAFLADLPSIMWTQVVASYGSSGKKKDGTTETWTPFCSDVVSVACDNRWDVQRRRNR